MCIYFDRKTKLITVNVFDVDDSNEISIKESDVEELTMS
jgi:hypothetical protein